jgi:CHAT domain-containing protein/Tfp pilus assembly protein PilF
MKNLLFLVLLFLPSILYCQSWEDLNGEGIEYYNSGDYKNALINWEKGVTQAEKEFGKNHEYYATSLNNLALLYKSMGQYNKAEPLYKEAIKIRKEVQGENHPDYATSINNLALLYQSMGKYDKVEPLFKEAMKTRKEVLGENHPDYAISLNNMALLYKLMGQYNKAEPLFKEAIKIKKEALGEKHPSYATSLNNLAILYDAMGQYDKAEPLYKEAMEIRKEVQGEKHPDYANSLNNLAIVYKLMKQYDKAALLFKEALKIRKDVLGKKHPDYANSLNSLAGLYDAMGQQDKAEPLYKEAMNIRKEILGEKHPDYANSISNLAGLYDAMGQQDKAEPLYKEAMNIRKEILGEKHPDYANSLNNLALLYLNNGQYEKAEPFFLKTNENYLNQIKIYYPALSESEKVKFLKTIEYDFDIFYSFGIKRIVENKNITKNIFDLRLNTKGLILSSTSNVRKRITESNDRELIEKFDKLLSLRTEIGKAYILSLEEQKKREINLKELEASANELEKEISLNSEDIKSERESRIIKCKDIQNSLKQNEAAVEFLDFRYFDKKWTYTTYYCAIISRPDLENPVLINLCTLNELKGYLSGSSENQNSYVRNDEKSSGLYNLIWKPLEKYLNGTEKVYISPSGILNKVSFALLKADEQNLLIDKYNLRYVGNLKEIVLKKESELKNKVLTASIFGGINYDIDTSNIKDVASKLSRGSNDEWNPPSDMILNNAPVTKVSKWNYLPGTLIEADKIKSLFESNNLKVNEFTGNEATKEALKSLNSKNSPTVLHISTHGYFFPEPQKNYKETGTITYIASDNPLFRSGLILAGANRVWMGGSEIEGIENGILTAYEVSNMDLMNTELVVLSACETGLGDIKGGEGVYGLQRAFKIAGAKTIIMSLWKVPDKETMELMELFYTNWLEKNITKRKAFSEAQKEMRKKYEPYYWAAFVMIE